MAHASSDFGTVAPAEMRLEEWAALPTHPRQRNTERHARARHWRPAAAADGAVAAVLRQVVAAELDGRLYKVDGHTRTYLWLQGRLPAPATVIVTIYRVRDEAELLRLYDVFDAPSAADQPFDKVWGAYRQHGMTIASNRLRGGQITSALGIALYGSRYKRPNKTVPAMLDVYDAIGMFRDELLIVDRLNVIPRMFPAGVLATALLGLAMYPEQTEFWEKVSACAGTKQEGMSDPIESVVAEVEAMRVDAKGRQIGGQLELAGRTMRGYQAWLNRAEEKTQYWFQNRLRAVELDPYVAEVKKLKGL